EEAELAAAVVELARELARVLPLLDVGGDLLGDEVPHRLAELLVLVGEGGQGRPLALVLDDGHQPATSSASPPGVPGVGALALATLIASSDGGCQSSSIV